MKCPHCTVTFHDAPQQLFVGTDKEGNWAIVKRTCPACGKLVLHLQSGAALQTVQRGGSPTPVGIANVTSESLVRPKGSARPPCPTEVPPYLREDYLEACVVLSDSPKASAALGRRCLQSLLREHVKVKKGDLYTEIQEVLDSGKLPSDLAESIDAIRNIGNFAAHPMKSTQSGLILDVEPGEAEWTLDVLEGLFDFYFVRPAETQRRKDAFNKKLADAGKPPIK
jgi:hypothetical protein